MMADSTNAERSLKRSTRYSVCEPDIDLYHAQPVETGRGDGVRVYTAQDAVYEALEDADGVGTRLWPDGEGYQVTVRVPVDGEREQDAYRMFRTIADRVGEVYDDEIPMSWLAFQTELDDGTPSRRAEHDRNGNGTRYGGGIRIRYREEGRNPIPEKEVKTYGDTGARLGMWGGGLGGMGAGMAGVIPVTAGLEPLLGIPGVVAGMAAGGMLGYAPFKARSWYANRQRRERFGDPGVVMEDTLFDRLNERNSLERLLDRNEPLPDRFTERYHTLLEEPLDEQWDIVETAHFDRFSWREGVTAEAVRFDTYEDAAAFTDVVRGEPEGSYERPSLYEEPAVFTELFDHLVHRVNGEWHMLDDAEVLVGNVVEHDAAEGVREFLDEAHPDLVRRAGQERMLSRGDQGCD